MPTIEWNETFSVHHTEIDDQHKRWIAIFNELHQTLLQGKPEELPVAGRKALRAMMDYAETHFTFEEDYMKEIGYSEIAAHASLHRDFRNRIYAYLRQMEDGSGLILNTEIIAIIKDWLLKHILVEDQKYAQFSSRHP